MKQTSVDLLEAVINSHVDFLMTELNGVYSTDYSEAKQYCEDLAIFYVVLECFDEFNFKVSPAEFNHLHSTLKEWLIAKDYLTEYEDWKNDVHTVAVDNGLEDGEEEVIELLNGSE